MQQQIMILKILRCSNKSMFYKSSTSATNQCLVNPQHSTKSRSWKSSIAATNQGLENPTNQCFENPQRSTKSSSWNLWSSNKSMSKNHQSTKLMSRKSSKAATSISAKKNKCLENPPKWQHQYQQELTFPENPPKQHVIYQEKINV